MTVAGPPDYLARILWVLLVAGVFLTGLAFYVNVVVW